MSRRGTMGTVRKLAVLAMGVLAPALAACTSSQAVPPTTQHGVQPTSTIAPPTTQPQTIPPVGILSVPNRGNGHTLELWSWDGKHLKSIHTGPAIGCCVFPTLSPNGQRILVPYSTGGGHAAAEVITTSGHLVARSPQFFGAIWASDSRHLCALEYNLSQGPPLEASFVLVTPGEPTRVIARVPTPGLTSHTGYQVESCDVAENQGVVFADHHGCRDERDSTSILPTAPGPSPAGASELRPSSFPATGITQVQALGQVIDTGTGRIVARLHGDLTAISWLGHVVVEVDQRAWRLEAVDWVTGKVLWTSGPPGEFPRPFPFADVASRPGTDDLALDVNPPHGARSSIWLVRPEGPAKLLDADAGPDVI